MYKSSNDIRGNSYLASKNRPRLQIPVSLPKSDEAKKWDGWQTSLKPANEPIVLARKPFRGSVVENVLKHGTGALNCRECEIDAGDEIRVKAGKSRNSYNGFGGNFPGSVRQNRYPTNVIIDEDIAGILDEEYLGKSRFFYCAKASPAERTERNTHPTVKPLKLMEYLVTLVTRPEYTVLDPFIGSGTTAVAAINTGRHYIGFEREKEYFDIAMERIQTVRMETLIF